jgi:hypothetical protein
MVQNFEFELLADYQWTRRYLDDLFTINNPSLTKFMYKDTIVHTTRGNDIHGIYDRGLKPGQTPTGNETMVVKVEHDSNTGDGTIIHLDVQHHWSTSTGHVECQLHDKRNVPKFDATKLRRFPDATTLLWSTCLEGCVNSELNRYYVNSSTHDHFVHAAGNCIAELYSLGYDYPNILHHATKFFQKNPLTKYNNQPNDCHNIGPQTNLAMITASARQQWQQGTPEFHHRNARLQLPTPDHSPTRPPWITPRPRNYRK